VEHNGIDDLRRRFDINIDSHKHYLESGDAFYQSWKDPEDWSTWITVNGIDYSHPGNAVVVGNEVGDGIADPAISLAELRRNVRFLSEWEKTKETVGQILDDMDPQNDKGIAHLWSILELPSDRTIRDLQKILREALQEVKERFQRGARIGHMDAAAPTPPGLIRCGHSSGVRTPTYG
jgi:hypothetical protein